MFVPNQGTRNDVCRTFSSSTDTTIDETAFEASESNIEAIFDGICSFQIREQEMMFVGIFHPRPILPMTIQHLKPVSLISKQSLTEHVCFKSGNKK